MTRKRKFINMALLATAGMAICTGTVFAYWRQTGEAVNVLTMSSYKNRIVEEYTVPDHVDPNQSVDKIVNIKNEGSVDSIIRVKIDKVIGDRGEDGKLIPDEALDVDKILIHYNDDYWVQLPDGYWYYTEVLKAGELTKEPLLDKYTLAEDVDNSYQGKEAEIIVSMDSVQAEGGAVSIWNVTEEDLGIHYKESSTNIVTKVMFDGRDDGFSFSTSDTDLFTNFKDLLPGCSRTQKVEILNRSDEKVQIFLKAEAEGQDKMSAEQLNLVQQLISKYATIKVQSKEGLIYEGTVDGNLSGIGETMVSDISLGYFDAGSQKDLVVTLSLDPAMDNRFMSLVGKVQWDFMAEGDEAGTENKPGSTETPEPGKDPGKGPGPNVPGPKAPPKVPTTGVLTQKNPKTGDATNIALYLVMFGSSFACLIAARKKCREIDN